MFKTGGRVKCINPVYALKGGKVYTVVSAVEVGHLTVRGGCGEVLPPVCAWRFVKVNTFKGNK